MIKSAATFIQTGIRQRSLRKHCRVGRATELVFVLATGAMLTIGGAAQAQDTFGWNAGGSVTVGSPEGGAGIWEEGGGTGLWQNITNSTTGNDFVTGENATFDAADPDAPYTVNVDGSVTTNGITIAANGVEIADGDDNGTLIVGGTLSVVGAIEATVSEDVTGDLTVDGAGTLNQSGDVTGVLTRTGAGTTVLTGEANSLVNTTGTTQVDTGGVVTTTTTVTDGEVTVTGGELTGLTTVNGGTLDIDSGTVGAVTNDGGTVEVGGGEIASLTQTLGDTTMDGGEITGTTDIDLGSFTFNGGTLGVVENAGEFVITADQTVGGSFTNETAGVINATTVTAGTDVTLTVSGFTNAGEIDTNNTDTVTISSDTITLNAGTAFDGAGPTLGGAVILDGNVESNVALSTSGDVTLTGTLTNNDTLTVSNAITSGAFATENTGTLNINAGGSISGDVTASDGTVTVDATQDGTAEIGGTTTITSDIGAGTTGAFVLTDGDVGAIVNTGLTDTNGLNGTTDDSDNTNDGVEITITDGVVASLTNTTGEAVLNGGTVTTTTSVAGGTVTNDGATLTGLASTSGTGTFTQTNGDADGGISNTGGTVNLDGGTADTLAASDGTTTVTGGSVTGETTISGGDVVVDGATGDMSVELAGTTTLTSGTLTVMDGDVGAIVNTGLTDTDDMDASNDGVEITVTDGVVASLTNTTGETALNGGTVTTTTSVAGGTVTNDGATLTGLASTSGTGTFTQTDGDADGGISNTGGTVNLDGGTAATLANTATAGTSTVTDGEVTGTTTVNGGEVVVNEADADADLELQGDTTVGTDGTLTVMAGQVDDVINDGGTVDIDGGTAATLTNNATAGTSTITDGEVLGTTTVNGGEVVVNEANPDAALELQGDTTVGTDGTLTVTAGQVDDVINDGGTVDIDGGTAATLTNNATAGTSTVTDGEVLGTTTVNGGEVVVNETTADAALELQGDTTVGTDGTLTVTAGQVDDVINDGGLVTLTSGTAETLDNNNVGMAAADIGTVDVDGDFTVANAGDADDAITNDGTLNVNSGTLTVTQGDVDNATTGVLTVDAGTTLTTSDGTTTNNGEMNVDGTTGNVGTVTGTVTNAATGTLSIGGGTVTGLVTNSGTLVAGGGRLDGGLTNGGMIDGNGGTTFIAGNYDNTQGITNGVTATSAPTTTLEFAGDFENNSSIDAGTGTLTIKAANVVLTGGTVSENVVFDTAGGVTLEGDQGGVARTGAFNVADNTEATGITTFTNTGTTNIGDMDMDEDGALLEAQAIVNEAGAIINVTTNSTLRGTANTNNNSGTMNVADGGSIIETMGDYNNLTDGVLNFDGPGTDAADEMTFDVAGAINNAGDINFNGGITNVSTGGTPVQNTAGGEITVDNGAVANFGAINNTGADAIVTVEGTLALTGSIVNQNGAQLIVNDDSGTATTGFVDGRIINGLTTVGNLDINGGTIADLNNGAMGDVDVIGGGISNGNITNAGTIDINTGFFSTASGTLVNNDGGEITLADGNTRFNAAEIANNSGATVTIGTTGQLNQTGNGLLTNAGTIDVADQGRVTSGGNISNSGTINFNGVGVNQSRLSANLGNAGGTIINTGTINVTDGNLLIDSDNIQTSGIIDVSDDSFILNATGLTQTDGEIRGDGTIQLDATVSTPGEFAQSGGETAGTVTITGGAFTQSGDGTTIGAGTTVTSTGAQALNGGSAMDAAIIAGDLDGAGTVTVSTGTTNLTGSITNATNATATDAGLAVTSGALNITGAGSVDTANNVIGVSGGTLLSDGDGIADDEAVTVSGDGVLDVDGDDTIASLDQTGGIVQGDSTLTVAGAYTQTGTAMGAQTTTGGTVTVEAATFEQSDGAIIADGTTVNATGDKTLSGGSIAGTLGGNGNATVDTGTTEVAGTISGTGITTVADTGTLALQDGGSVTSSLTNNGGIVTADGDASITGAVVTLTNADGGTLLATDGSTLTIEPTASIAAGPGQLTVGDATNTGTVVLGSTGGLSANGAASLAVNGGTLQIGAAIVGTNLYNGNGTDVSVADGATIDMNGFETRLGNLLGAGTVTNNGADDQTLTLNGTFSSSGATESVFSGSITDGTSAVALTKSGLLQTTLTGENTYTGATNVNAGEIAVTGAGTLASTDLNVTNAGSTLSTDGGALAADAAVTVNADATFSITGDETIATVSGLGGVEINDATMPAATTTLTLTGETGDMAASLIGGTVSGTGTLDIEGDATVDTTGDVSTDTTVDADGTLVNNGIVAGVSNAGSFTNNLTAGALTNTGVGTGSNASTGTLASLQHNSTGTFTNVGNITGDANITVGTLDVNGGMIGDIAISGGSLLLGGTSTSASLTQTQADAMVPVSTTVDGDATVTNLVDIQNGTLTVNDGTTLTADSGVQGQGNTVINIAGTIDGNVASVGTVNVTDAAATVEGNLTSFNELSLAGSGPSGVLTVDGDVTLGGNLTIQGTTPSSVSQINSTGDLIQSGAPLSLTLDNPGAGDPFVSAVLFEFAGTSNLEFGTFVDFPNAGALEYFVDEVDNTLVLTTRTNTAISNIAATVGLTQTLVNTVVNRPTSPFVADLAAGADEEPCGAGGWVRATGGTADATGVFTDVTSGAGGETPVGLDYAGLQFGGDFACFGGHYDGWDLAFGAIGGFNDASSSSQSFGFGGDLQNNLSSDIFQKYAGVYVTAARGRFFADLQYRFEDTSFETSVTQASDGGLADFDTEYDNEGQTLSGAVGYSWPIGDDSGLTFVSSAGFSLSKNETDDVALGDNGTLSFEDGDSQVAFLSASLASTVILPDEISLVSYFGTATIYNDFADDRTATFTLADDTTRELALENIGAYGEISLGVNYLKLLTPGQAGNARQLNASVRVDARFSDRLESYGITGQFRLQF